MIGAHLSGVAFGRSGLSFIKKLKETLDSNYWLGYFMITNSEERILNCAEPV